MHIWNQRLKTESEAKNMKKQHRRWISLFLVLVFILNGIFLDVPELHQAASQFTFANHKVVFSDQDTILHASANILRNADFCTEDLLGIQSRDASSLRGVRDGRRSTSILVLGTYFRFKDFLYFGNGRLYLHWQYYL